MTGVLNGPVRHNKLLTPLTDQELDAVTIVFHQYETGLREGTIYTKVGVTHYILCHLMVR